jgi:hypothetical protein
MRWLLLRGIGTQEVPFLRVFDFVAVAPQKVADLHQVVAVA